MEKTTCCYAHPTGLALSVTASIVYSVCAFFVAVMPGQTMKFFNDWFHGIDLSSLLTVKQITFGTFFRGLIEIAVFAYITGLIYGLAYNKCVAHCKKKGWI